MDQAVERKVAIEAQITALLPNWSLGPVVKALQALRGVALAVAAGVIAEIGDLRRFDNPRQLLAYLGLVPGERSSGEKRRPTRAGSIVARKLIVEAAWAYRMPATVGHRAFSVGTTGSPGKPAPSHGRRKSDFALDISIPANAGETEDGADRDHCRCAGTRRVQLTDRQGKRDKRGDGQGVDAGLGNPPPKIGSGRADLRGSDPGSPTTYTWHAVANPRIRNCSTVAKAPAP